MRPGTVVRALCTRPMHSLGYKLRAQMRRATPWQDDDYCNWLERRFESPALWLGRRLLIRSVWLIEDTLTAEARRYKEHR